MSLEKCPSCGKKSLIKVPRSRVMRETFGTMIHVANEHSLDCLNKNCKYTSGQIRINTNLGKKLSLPWYKRILGEKLYCSLFHTSYGMDDKWYCPKCKISKKKKLSDYDTSPL